MSLQEQWAAARSRRAAQNQSLLSGSRQQRLEQHRALMAELRQRCQERQEAIRQQREQSRSQLRNLEQSRVAQRALDEHSRLEAVAQRAKAVAELLSRMAQERAAQSQAQQQELRTFRADLAATVESLLSTCAQARQAMANQTRQVRQAFCAELRQRVQALQQLARQELAQIAQEQRAEAEALRQALAAFRRALHEQMWGNGIPGDQAIVPDLEESEEGDKPPESSVKATATVSSEVTQPELGVPVSDNTAPPPPSGAPPEPSPAPPASAQEESSDRIMAYVCKYVEALQAQNPNLTLLQVIGDRELLRDLLARVAVDLGVDPAEILATLRRMVSATVVV
ncbi:gas vesicle protein GvpC [Synechococcus sp. OH2]|uniref:gas vesicle protein GvpC n=1 Tax=Synechococcus sp. OH2 TaxID=136798 RepID=UPI0039C3BE27